ncbi:MAG: class I SAM-dependent methyltransferase [Pirellulales bacterium]|nr:class I SAM-dependent methyltransferase [Pirellulales bacterium]
MDGHRFHHLLHKLKRLQPSGRLVDVGCGGGQLLAEARRTGSWELFGVEPSPMAAKLAAKHANCTVWESTLHESPLEIDSVDIMAMIGVLEHLHDPLGTLRYAHRLLKSDGLLAVYVPNFNYLRLKDTGPVAWLRSRRWSNLHPQEHMFHFTTQSLTRLLRVAGFELVDVDIGYPFLRGGRVKRCLKLAAYGAVRGIWKIAGVHCGGIECITRRCEI